VDGTAVVWHVGVVQFYRVVGICGRYCGDVTCWFGTVY
jgi:hypothetical protein